MRKLFGVFTGVPALIWWFFRETIENWFFGKVLEMVRPDWSWLIEYGPPLALLLLTIYLFFPDIKAKIASHKSKRNDSKLSVSTYSLQLSGLEIIQNERNAKVDLAIGLKIKNTSTTPLTYVMEKMEVSHSHGMDVSSQSNIGDGVIRTNSDTIFNYRYILPNHNKNESVEISARVVFSVLYGPVDGNPQRRWSQALNFKIDPTRQVPGRYSTEFDKDEPA